VHGGAEKAIYWYPVGHYARWRALLPHHAAKLVPGAFGENLTIEEFDEDDVAIGDIFRVGQATLQITQPRQPCLKLALRFDDPQLVKAMIRTGMSGWYTRVLEAGEIEAGAVVDLLDRPNPEWSIARFNRFINNQGGTGGELAELANLRGLPRAWQRAAHAALRTVLRAHTKELLSQAPGSPSAQDSNPHP
jgi:MOSC domain-containing protein YiiM